MKHNSIPSAGAAADSRTQPIVTTSADIAVNPMLGEGTVEKKEKPIKAKPVFYACCFEPLKSIAKEMGYNLLINGSLNRDMDLVAIAWVDEPKPMVEVVKAFDMYLRDTCYADGSEERGYLYSVLPANRHSFVINLNRGGRWNNYTDEQWYVDISFTPLPNKAGSAFA